MEHMDKVVSRICKMLALANDAAASEGERDNAMRMAHATLAKHNLDMATIEAAGEAQTEKREDAHEVGYGYPWTRIASNAIAQLYFCYYYSRAHPSRSDLCFHHFIGKQSNVVTSREMAKYIVASILSEANKRKTAEKQSWAWHTSFCKGAAAKVYERCKELRATAERSSQPATGTAIVLASVYATELTANQQFLADLGVHLVTKASRQRSAQRDGYESGQAFGSNISLNRQLTGTRNNVARLR